MAKNNQNKQRDEGGLLPVIAANLIGNLIEMGTDSQAKTTGGEIRRLGRVHKLSMVALETAIATAIEKAGFSQAGKILSVQLVDHVFDVIRRLPTDAEYSTSLRAIEEGGRSALALVKTKLGQVAKAKSTSKLPKILSELDQQQLEIFVLFGARLQTVDRQKFDRWQVWKDNLEKEQVMFLVGLPSDIHRWMYLETAFGKKQEMFSLETVEAVLRGEKTRETDALAKKVADTEKNIDDLSRKLKKETARMKRQFS